jgi:hypothetical protein
MLRSAIAWDPIPANVSISRIGFVIFFLIFIKGYLFLEANPRAKELQGFTAPRL